jgi:hypothetical protein
MIELAIGHGPWERGTDEKVIVADLVVLGGPVDFCSGSFGSVLLENVKQLH